MNDVMTLDELDDSETTKCCVEITPRIYSLHLFFEIFIGRKKMYGIKTCGLRIVDLFSIFHDCQLSLNVYLIVFFFPVTK